MRVRTTGMAVHFDPVAIPFAGELTDVGFQVFADATTAGAVFHGEVTDARKIAGQCDLRDELKRKEANDFGIQLIDKKDLVRLGSVAPDLFFQIVGGIIIELGDQCADGFGVGELCAADHGWTKLLSLEYL